MRKLFWLRVKEFIVGKELKYLTAKEKAEMILKGEEVPVYIDKSSKFRLVYGVVPERRFIPGNRKKSTKNIKL